MFQKDQLSSILKRKNAAFKILLATQAELKKSCQKAQGFIKTNVDEITKKKEEITSLEYTNTAIKDQITYMEASIEQTEAIINPAVEKLEENGKK